VFHYIKPETVYVPLIEGELLDQPDGGSPISFPLFSDHNASKLHTFMLWVPDEYHKSDRVLEESCLDDKLNYRWIPEGLRVPLDTPAEDLLSVLRLVLGLDIELKILGSGFPKSNALILHV
jgi:hypothetical protein